MEHDMRHMEDQKKERTMLSPETGTKDTTYNLVSVIYHALQGAQNYAMYAEDAKQDGGEFSNFFNDLKREEERRAERAKQLLKKKLDEEM